MCGWGHLDRGIDFEMRYRLKLHGMQLCEREFRLVWSIYLGDGGEVEYFKVYLYDGKNRFNRRNFMTIIEKVVVLRGVDAVLKERPKKFTTLFKLYLHKSIENRWLWP